MGQAAEGYNNVTHENELLCDFTHAHVSPSVNESILLAVNPASAYQVVESINRISIKFMLDTGASVSLVNECTWNKLAKHTI